MLITIDTKSQNPKWYTRDLGIGSLRVKDKPAAISRRFSIKNEEKS